MNILYKVNPIKKQEEILRLAALGKTRKEIAQALGYKGVDGVNVFIKKIGNRWDTKNQIFIVKYEKKEEPKESIQESLPDKVRIIITMFDKKMDSREIAKALSL